MMPVARIAYGVEQISKALQETGYQVVIAKKASYGGRTPQILAGTLRGCRGTGVREAVWCGYGNAGQRRLCDQAEIECDPHCGG